jgi:hypothetical protein
MPVHQEQVSLRAGQISSHPGFEYTGDLHPPSPPFPVLRKRPDQFFGSQASRTIPLMLDVDTCMLTRHKSADTTWKGRVQVGLLLGNVRFVPEGTKVAKLTVTFSIAIDCARAAHEALKLLAVTPANLYGAGTLPGAAVLVAVNAARTTATVERPKLKPISDSVCNSTEMPLQDGWIGFYLCVRDPPSGTTK